MFMYENKLFFPLSKRNLGYIFEFAVLFTTTLYTANHNENHAPPHRVFFKIVNILSGAGMVPWQAAPLLAFRASHMGTGSGPC